MNQLMNPELQAIAEFIERETGFPRKRVEGSTTLLEDIGLDGDDAERFFLAFGKQFGVSLDGLKLNRHFGGEGSAAGVLAFPIKLTQRLFGSRDPHQYSGLQVIRVEHLLKAAKSKHWIDT